MSPLAAQVLPISTDTFLGIIGVVEILVGLAILSGWTRLGAYAAGAWLIGVAVNLTLAGYFDVAVRDVVMALAAFTLARLTEVREASASHAFSVAAQPHRQVAVRSL